MASPTPIQLSPEATLPEVVAALAAHLDAGAGTLMVQRETLYLIVNQPDSAPLRAIQHHTGGGLTATRQGEREYPMLQMTGTRAAVVLGTVLGRLTSPALRDQVQALLTGWSQAPLNPHARTWRDKLLAEMRARGWDTATLSTPQTQPRPAITLIPTSTQAMPRTTPIQLSPEATLPEVVAALAAHLDAGAGRLMIQRGQLYLVINQPSVAPLQAIQRYTGGGISQVTRKARQYASLAITATRAAVVLGTIWPRLTDRRQHEIVESLLDEWTRRVMGTHKRGRIHTTLTEMEARGWDTSTLLPLRLRER